MQRSLSFYTVNVDQFLLQSNRLSVPLIICYSAMCFLAFYADKFILCVLIGWLILFLRLFVLVIGTPPYGHSVKTSASLSWLGCVLTEATLRDYVALNLFSCYICFTNTTTRNGRWHWKLSNLVPSYNEMNHFDFTKLREGVGGGIVIKFLRKT